MADLPSSRVDFPNPPFTLTGVDYFETETDVFRAGDQFRWSRERNAPVSKVLCNYVVLNAKLQQEGLDWNFNPPFAPHMGGAWEAMVKLAKRAITATTNGAQLTDDELSTVAAECEAMLNNRPLTYVGSDPDDIEPLTPAHFLAAGQLMPLLPSEIQVEEVSPKRRWLFLQSITSKIWKRWQKEYLPCLQRRPKWNQTVRNLEPGDLVLILDPNQPRGRWLRGKIEETFPDDRKCCAVSQSLNSEWSITQTCD
jgi:hypothetical protein